MDMSSRAKYTGVLALVYLYAMYWLTHPLVRPSWTVPDCAHTVSPLLGIKGPACMPSIQDSNVDPTDMRSLELLIPMWLQRYPLCRSEHQDLLWYYYRSTVDLYTTPPAGLEEIELAKAANWWHSLHPGVAAVMVCTADRIGFCGERSGDYSTVWKDTIALVYHVDAIDMSRNFVILPAPAAIPYLPQVTEKSIFAFFAGTLYGTGPGIFRQKMAYIYPAGNAYGVVVSEILPDYHDKMKQAIFCLCLQGWAPWSPRIYEALAAGCIPVFYSTATSAPVQLPFPDLVDWQSFSVVIPEERAAFTHEILRMVDVAAKQQALKRAAPEVLWLQCPSRVLGNVLHEIELVRQNQSRRSYTTIN